MVEENKTNPANPEDSGAKSFTQADVDKIVSERVNKLNESTQRKIDEAVAAALEEEREKSKLASLEGEDKLKATYEGKLKKQTAEMAKTAEELQKARAELSKSRAEAQLAANSLPPELAPAIIGENDEATAANIKMVLDCINAEVTKRVNEALSRGPPKLGGSVSAPDWQAQINAAMKVRE